MNGQIEHATVIHQTGQSTKECVTSSHPSGKIRIEVDQKNIFLTSASIIKILRSI